MTFTPYPAEADSDRAPRSTLGERLWGTAVVVAVGLGVLVVTWESAGYGMGPWLLGTSWFWWGLALWLLVGGVGAVALGKVWGHWSIAVLAMLVASSLAYATLDEAAARRGMTPDPQGWFEDHRDEFDQAARWAEANCCVDTYLGDDLPQSLAHLSARGTVTGESGALFFAQWYGIPDDAGGYWYSPDTSPGGNDMFGAACINPTDLGEGWWMCGM